VDNQGGKKRVNAKQMQIDFDRASKLRMLEKVVLPIPSGAKTSAVACKAILKTIDGHAREKDACCLKVETIARESGLSRAAAHRAIKALEQNSLLIVIRRIVMGKRASEYKICWPNLRDLLFPAQSEEGKPMAHDAPSDVARCANRCSTVRHPMSHGATSYKAPLDKRPIETPEEKRFDVGKLSFEDSKTTSSDVAHVDALTRRWAIVLTPRSQADRDNLFRVAVLVAAGEIAEAEPEKIIQSMISHTRQNRIKKPMGYFLDSLRKNLERCGQNLSALMRSVDLHQRCSL
jgi:hypothetical protein